MISSSVLIADACACAEIHFASPFDRVTGRAGVPRGGEAMPVAKVDSIHGALDCKRRANPCGQELPCRRGDVLDVGE